MSEDATLVAERARQVADRTAGAANQEERLQRAEAAAQERERLLKRQVSGADTSISIIITTFTPQDHPNTLTRPGTFLCLAQSIACVQDYYYY
jgi:hypothetical protein